MVTDAPEAGTSGQSYSVARAIREVGARSRLGVMAVQRLSTEDAGNVNRTFAIDGRLGLGQKWTTDVWAAKTSTPGRTGDDMGYSLRAAFATNVFNANNSITGH
jgi:hypothetical protein